MRIRQAGEGIRFGIQHSWETTPLMTGLPSFIAGSEVPSAVAWNGASLIVHRLFCVKGRLFWLDDATGQPLSGDLAEGWPVLADVRYELQPSPHHPLQVDVFGRDPLSMGQVRERLVLDNGVVLTGRTCGGGFGRNSDKPPKTRLLDIEESKIELFSAEAGSSFPDMDAAVLGVVSSRPLAHGACARGAARPGLPFSFRARLPRNPGQAAWSTAALRLDREGVEMTFVRTSGYWRKMVDSRVLVQDAVVGVRRVDRRILEREEFYRVVSLLSGFLGWINHCVSPVFHVKGYREGHLVYRGFNLHARPTVQRDAFSWLPMFGPEDERGASADVVQCLLDGFARAWDTNVEENGIFHIALGMLGSRSKGSPRDGAAFGYIRDTFSACSILFGMLSGLGGRRPRRDVIYGCLQKIGVDDKLPLEGRYGADHLVQEHSKLWWGERRGKVLEEEFGNLSRPLANVENWLLHMDDPKNAKMLLDLPVSVQQYFVEVSTWLADLMVLKVVGHRGWYFNRLTRETEVVPWEK